MLIDQIGKIGIVPVIKIDDISKAIPLAKALCDGGLPCAEITFRTDAAEEAIRLITNEFPQMLVGAGTVLNIEQVDKALSAGAKFIVSPGINPKVVSYCVSKGVSIIPGCITPSEIEIAIEHGLNTVKFFPAEQAGGLDMIKAMSAPYTQIKFMPTGGITLDNLSQYLSNKKIVACGGSFMVSDTLINSGNFEEITRLCKQAVDLVSRIRKV